MVNISGRCSFLMRSMRKRPKATFRTGAEITLPKLKNPRTKISIE
jgi:hypothetical protein